MKNKIKLLALLFAVTISLSSFSQSSNDGNWIKIAEKLVAFKSDKDVITPTGNERKVDKIKIKCVQGTLKLKKVRVEMSDGEKKEYDAKGVGVLSKGMSSLPFNLPGKNNTLKKIELEYDSVGVMMVTKRAKVEIMGHVIK
ncbi:hypothetical protein BXU11_02565 [Flavobacterium sp. LM5]|jgi:hypothetical protein|uniref:hypothetical protein n=1 Tax=Flavobacterium sp. LM5 TaxID=1938610 RepID=UPI0009922023|nr:hypothetical protein [Flavobacterium sp. LM5]OOV28845.1 hypothetical protein BXU11_02565 [Flavobacterium sp. LM5]